MRLDNAVPNAATCRSLELGVIRCIDETAEQVRRNTGLSVTETQIERVLRGESCSMAEEARRIVDEIKDIDLGDGVTFEVKEVSNIMDEMEYPNNRFTVNAVMGKSLHR